jgi:hypothetical protein
MRPKSAFILRNADLNAFVFCFASPNGFNAAATVWKDASRTICHRGNARLKLR